MVDGGFGGFVFDCRTEGETLKDGLMFARQAQTS